MKSHRCLLVFAAITSLGGCVHGPSTEKKSKLNYLNGKHYEATSSISGIPSHLERQVVSSKIEGVVQIASEIVPLPARFQRLKLIHAGKIILECTSNSTGHFAFAGEIPNGSYVIRVASPKYIGETTIDVNSYEIKDIVFIIRKVAIGD